VDLVLFLSTRAGTQPEADSFTIGSRSWDRRGLRTRARLVIPSVARVHFAFLTFWRWCREQGKGGSGKVSEILRHDVRAKFSRDWRLGHLVCLNRRRVCLSTWKNNGGASGIERALARSIGGSMSPDVWLLFTDIGITGFITAVIVSLAIVLGRRESRFQAARLCH
jgi:hypothetical protein